MRALVIGAGLAGLAATERLLDQGARVTVVDSFPVPGGRTANFDVPVPVAGLLPGDVVEHGLHAWFQHYHALYAFMARAGIRKPPFAGDGVYLWNDRAGHFEVEGGPLFWLFAALGLPEPLRGSRTRALAAFLRLIRTLEHALDHPEETDQEAALPLLLRFGVPAEAIDSIFRPCLYSLTSLRLEELSALELLRWMSRILPDPRIRCLEGGGTTSMCAPIARHLAERGADFRFGVELRSLSLDSDGRPRMAFAEAPDRTGVRHVLVPGFRPADVPDAEFDAVVCTLPWERLREVGRSDPGLFARTELAVTDGLRNIHPLTMRLWFERPIQGAAPHYTLSSGTVFDVFRPTPEASRGEGIRLVDALVENVETELPGFVYRGERFIPRGPESDRILELVLADLERVFPGQVLGNPLARSYLHTREGIIACRPGVFRHRPPQFVGSRHFVVAGDWTRQSWGVCMEGAVRSGELAVESLLLGKQAVDRSPAFSQVLFSLWSRFERG